VQSIQASQDPIAQGGDDDAVQRMDKDDGTTESASALLPYRIGGPNTSLPFFVESFLGWSLCLSCLTISGYHYVKSTMLSSGWNYLISFNRRARRNLQGMFGGTIEHGPMDQESNHPNLLATGNEAPWIPLTTHSRAELERQSPWERYQSLLRILEKKYPEVLTSSVEVDNDVGCKNCNNNNLSPNIALTDAALIRVLRHDNICRRLASLALRPYDPSNFAESPSNENSHTPTARSYTTTLPKQLPHNQLLQRMSKHWNHFLALPSLEDVKSFRHLPSCGEIPVATSHNKIRANDANYSCRISLILPAFRESGSHLLTKLTKALEISQDPNEVEVIIVDAGGCNDLEVCLAERDTVDSEDNHYWGRISIFSHDSGGGRGPCLNFGASVATGRILTFCHSDTMLPYHWDGRIVSTLEFDSEHSTEPMINDRRASSCAFSFGIDTSREGLCMPFEKVNTLYYPPGVKAVEFSANLRTHLYSLPYGDQVLSLHACIFHFLGGFPDQCLMEDYELVSLLRHRAALISSPSYSSGNGEREKLAIISGEPALCSPRRWQKFGVLYVTYMNSTFVNLYAGASKMGPDDLYRRYYGTAPPTRNAAESPWELELVKILAD